MTSSSSNNEQKTQSSSNNNEGKNENTSEENLPKSSSNNNEGKNENTSEENLPKISSNNNEVKNENTIEENLPKISSNNNEGKIENSMEEKNADSRLFSCSFCHHKFSTQQALAGHQNAHRAERALEKQRKERPLGVRMEAFIRKPPSASPNIGLGALGLTDMLNPSLVSTKNNIEGCSNGVGVQGIGGETTPRIEDDAGKKFVDFLKVGDFSNVASTSNIMDLNLNSNNEEESSNSESESESELDLTLKL
ncbi:zinc finger protein [Trifolium pratense]|uniref:Zinc finger protein n=1 Tax=Trifolium pratense TaxID=57577 RepID=A0A2K3NCH4_TRIPR|nr:zinc finger protein [Trifolium pratense]